MFQSFEMICGHLYSDVLDSSVACLLRCLTFWSPSQDSLLQRSHHFNFGKVLHSCRNVRDTRNDSINTPEMVVPVVKSHVCREQYTMNIINVEHTDMWTCGKQMKFYWSCRWLSTLKPPSCRRIWIVGIMSACRLPLLLLFVYSWVCSKQLFTQAVELMQSSSTLQKWCFFTKTALDYF